MTTFALLGSFPASERQFIVALRSSWGRIPDQLKEMERGFFWLDERTGLN